MREGISDEVARARFLEKIVDRRLRRQQRDGVVQHGRAAIYHLIGVDPTSIARFDARDLWRDYFEVGSGLRKGVFDGLEKRSICALRNQDAELAAFETLRSLLHDAENGRGLEVLPWEHGSIRGLGHLLQSERHADLGGERLVDIQEMRDHPLADGGSFHFTELKRQGRGDVMLLAHGLADEELTCLAVVISEAFGPRPSFRTILDIGK